MKAKESIEIMNSIDNGEENLVEEEAETSVINNS